MAIIKNIYIHSCFTVAPIHVASNGQGNDLNGMAWPLSPTSSSSLYQSTEYLKKYHMDSRLEYIYIKIHTWHEKSFSKQRRGIIFYRTLIWDAEFQRRHIFAKARFYNYIKKHLLFCRRWSNMVMADRLWPDLITHILKKEIVARPCLAVASWTWLPTD